jgi:SSS family solute:Na+ symporter
MFTGWATPAGSFSGLLCGVLTGATYNLALHHGAIAYGSQMIANFYGAIYAFSACLFVTTAVSLFTPRKSAAELHGVTYFTQDQATHRISTQSYVLAATLLATCIALNLIFR